MEKCNCSENMGCSCGSKHGRLFKWFLVVVLLFVFLSFIDKDGNKDQVKNTITVTGKSEKMVKPDIATITIGITEEAKTVATAQEKATTKINSAITAVKDLGVDEKDIKTTNYSIYPRYDYIKAAPVNGVEYYSGKQVLAGYTVSQSLEIKIRDLTKVGDVIAKASASGLTDVGSLSFSVDKEDAVKDEVRNGAIADAKTNARDLSKQLGVHLGKLVSYTDNNTYPVYARDYMSSAKAVMLEGAGSAPTIPAGENKIVSNVTLVYEIR